MGYFNDLTGKRFSRWTVLGVDHREQKYDKNGKKNGGVYFYKCRCDCGNEGVVCAGTLTNGESKSCGCYGVEVVSKLFKKYNQYDLSGEYGVGYTFNGKIFKFDIEDFPKIKDICWYSEQRTGYIVSKSSNKMVRMHNYITGFDFVDHINRDKADNRRSNLREADKSRNEMNKGVRSNNKSGVTGVHFNNKRNRWVAVIDKLNIHRSKYFSNKDDAIQCRLLWEKELFGEYSGQKELFEVYGIE